MSLAVVTIWNTMWKEIEQYTKDFATTLTFDKIVQKLLDETNFSACVDLIIGIVQVGNNHDDGTYTMTQSIISLSLNGIIIALSTAFPQLEWLFTSLDYIINLIADGIFNYQNGNYIGSKFYAVV